MNRYQRLFDQLDDLSFSTWLDVLPGQVEKALHPDRNKLIPAWDTLIQSLPDVRPSSIDLATSMVRVGGLEELNDDARHQMERSLKELHPWRKGPFSLFGVEINTEWRSDLKWDRLAESIQPLEDRLVLDVGCGNGYHCWRMRGDKAKLVVGIDPMALYVAQFFAVQRYLEDQPVFVLPLRD